MPTYEDWLLHEQRNGRMDVCGTRLQPNAAPPPQQEVFDPMTEHWFAKPRYRVKAWRVPNQEAGGG